MLTVFDVGYAVSWLALLLKDLSVELAALLRSDRVPYFPAAVTTSAAPSQCEVGKTAKPELSLKANRERAG